MKASAKCKCPYYVLDPTFVEYDFKYIFLCPYRAGQRGQAVVPREWRWRPIEAHLQISFCRLLILKYFSDLIKFLYSFIIHATLDPKMVFRLLKTGYILRMYSVTRRHKTKWRNILCVVDSIVFVVFLWHCCTLLGTPTEEQWQAMTKLPDYKVTH
jgi:hypothetical protein